MGPDIDRFPPTPARVGLASEAQPVHISSKLGESESDLFRDSADHHEICCTTL
jgi:hypothetical protein